MNLVTQRYQPGGDGLQDVPGDPGSATSLQMNAQSFRSMPTGAFSKRPSEAFCKSQMGK